MASSSATTAQTRSIGAGRLSEDVKNLAERSVDDADQFPVAKQMTPPATVILSSRRPQALKPTANASPRMANPRRTNLQTPSHHLVGYSLPRNRTAPVSFGFGAQLPGNLLGQDGVGAKLSVNVIASS